MVFINKKLKIGGHYMSLPWVVLLSVKNMSTSMLGTFVFIIIEILIPRNWAQVHWVNQGP